MINPVKDMLIFSFTKHSMHYDQSGWVLWCVRQWGGLLPMYTSSQAATRDLMLRIGPTT